jgi:hypothetical protein
MGLQNLTSGNFFSAGNCKGPYKTRENLDDTLICCSGAKLQPITFGPIALEHLQWCSVCDPPQ